MDRYLAHAYLDDDAAGGDHHYLMVIGYGLYADYIAGLFGDLVALKALAATLLHSEFFQLGTLADAVFGNYEK